MAFRSVIAERNGTVYDVVPSATERNSRYVPSFAQNIVNVEGVRDVVDSRYTSKSPYLDVVFSVFDDFGTVFAESLSFSTMQKSSKAEIPTSRKRNGFGMRSFGNGTEL